MAVAVGGVDVSVAFGVALLVAVATIALAVGEAISLVVQAVSKRKKAKKKEIRSFKINAYLVISFSEFCASHASMRLLPLIKNPS